MKDELRYLLLVAISISLLIAGAVLAFLAGIANAAEAEVTTYKVDSAYPYALRSAIKEWNRNGASLQRARASEGVDIIFRRRCLPSRYNGYQHGKRVVVSTCSGASKREVKGTYVHEIGHTLGIDRHLKGDNVMNRVSSDAGTWRLQKGDLRAYRRSAG